MAWNFDGVNDYVEGANSSAWHLQDGDWTVFILVQILDNSGGNNGFLYNTLSDDFPSSGFIDAYVSQDNHATSSIRGDIGVDFNDDGNSLDPQLYIETTGTPPFTGNAAWTSVRISRAGNTISLYINNVLRGTWTNAGIDAMTPTGIYWGTRFDLVSDRFFRGRLAEFSVWSRELSGAEGELLWNGSKGVSALALSPGPQAYVPMKSGDYTEKIAGIAVTNNGTTGATHPPIYYEKSVAGALTFSGGIARRMARAVFGAFGFSGILNKVIKRPILAGAFGLAGTLIKTIKRPLLTGVFGFAGALATTVKASIPHDVAGAFTFTGALKKTIIPPKLTGVLMLAGVVPKTVKKVLTGILTFLGDVTPEPDLPPIPVGENLFSCDATDPRKVYKHDGFTTTITTSITAPASIPNGVVWLRTQDRLVSSDAGTNKVYVHSGLTTTISSSYTHAHGANLRNITCDREDNIYVTGSGTTDKFYKMSGLTSTITTSITTPGIDPRGISWGRDNNLYTSDLGASKYYKHSGFTTTITTSFTQAWTNDGMCVNPGLGVIDVSVSTGKAVRMANGFSSSVVDSISTPAASPRAVDWETRLLLTTTQNNAGAFGFAGALATTVSTWILQNVAGAFTFSGNLVTEVFDIVIQVVSGALTFSGTVKRTISKRFTGTLTFTGAMSYFVYIPNRIYRTIRARIRVILKD